MSTSSIPYTMDDINGYRVAISACTDLLDRYESMIRESLQRDKPVKTRKPRTKKPKPESDPETSHE